MPSKISWEEDYSPCLGCGCLIPMESTVWKRFSWRKILGQRRDAKCSCTNQRAWSWHAMSSSIGTCWSLAGVHTSKTSAFDNTTAVTTRPISLPCLPFFATSARLTCMILWWRQGRPLRCATPVRMYSFEDQIRIQNTWIDRSLSFPTFVLRRSINSR